MHNSISTTTTVALSLALFSSSAFAGGFAVREQSATLMGMAFAGAASGVDLSSSYWNPASFGIAERGFTTESHYSLIIGNTEITGQVVNDGSARRSGNAGADATVDAVLNNMANNANAGSPSSDIDRPAIVGASYAAYRLNDKVVLGVSMNAPFGLSTEPDDSGYAGRGHGLNSSLFTLNLTPTLAYEVTKGVHLAAGVQLQYADLAFKFNSISAAPGGQSIGNAEIDVTDEIGVGFTLGVLLKPAAGTSVGVGFRSSVSHNFEGELGIPGNRPVDVQAELDLPEIVTVSLSQALSPALRVHATYEWTNWSRFDSIPVAGSAPADVIGGVFALFGAGAQQNLSLNGPWEDGHFVSGGLEYDVNEQLTLRGGVAWEKSPIQTPQARLLQVPDSDRVWLAFGAGYKWSEMTTLEFGYTHIFFEDAPIDRASLSAEPLVFQGNADSSADIIAVSLKTKWGENGLQDMIGSIFGAE